MQNPKQSVLVFLLLISSSLLAQDPFVVQEYISTYKNLAIAEMQRTGVPTAIKLAQGIHETNAGQSALVIKSNNHFGIKCKSNWTGPSVLHDDDAKGECFRKYNTAVDSYLDHSNFLSNNQRYAFLFNLDPTDYEGWANGLKKAGYATNPKYAQILIRLIKEYNLQDYTLIAMGKKIPEPEILVSASVIKNNGENNAAIMVSNQSKEINQLVVNKTYPSGEFSINETKVIYAAKGTSFLSLALKYNIPLSRIFEFNDMKKQEEVDEDQLIFLQRKRKTGNNEFHIVAKGETLHYIAQTQAIRLQSLMEYNSLSENIQPAPGEKLFLKAKATGTASPVRIKNP